MIFAGLLLRACSSDCPWMRGCCNTQSSWGQGSSFIHYNPATNSRILVRMHNRWSSEKYAKAGRHMRHIKTIALEHCNGRIRSQSYDDRTFLSFRTAARQLKLIQPHNHGSSHTISGRRYDFTALMGRHAASGLDQWSGIATSDLRVSFRNETEGLGVSIQCKHPSAVEIMASRDSGQNHETHESSRSTEAMRLASQVPVSPCNLWARKSLQDYDEVVSMVHDSARH